MGEKKLWNIFHEYDVDSGMGGAMPIYDLVGTVEATEDEINRFIQKWNKPEVYDHPYDDLRCHTVYAKEVKFVDLNELEPYSTDPLDWFVDGIRRWKS